MTHDVNLYMGEKLNCDNCYKLARNSIVFQVTKHTLNGASPSYKCVSSYLNKKKQMLYHLLMTRLFYNQSVCSKQSSNHNLQDEITCYVI